MSAPTVKAFVIRGGIVHRTVEVRPISPDIVEFAFHGRAYYETARWIQGRYQSEGQDREASVLYTTSFSKLPKLAEWRPDYQQMGRWAVTTHHGSEWLGKKTVQCQTMWLDKSRPPPGNCELVAKSASGNHAATITVAGNRIAYKVDRGDAPAWTGEKLWAPHLLFVVSEVEEEWDRWWWLQSQRDPEDT